MINYLKNGNINIKIDVNQKDVLKTNLEFWSHDLKSGLLTIKYTNLGEPVPLVCDSAVRLIMRFTEKGETKHRIETMTVTDKINGIATLEIPDEILGYEGIVECGTYIDFKNGQTLDAGYFTFRMRKSMIDGKFKELDELYVKDFSEAVEKIKQQIIDYEREHATLIGNSTREFNEFLTTSQKKVDDMLNSDVKLDTTIFRDYERNNNHYVSQLDSKIGEFDNLANSLNNEIGTVVEKVGTLPTQADLNALKSVATVTENGLMSNVDKVKLDSLAKDEEVILYDGMDTNLGIYFSADQRYTIDKNKELVELKIVFSRYAVGEGPRNYAEREVRYSGSTVRGWQKMKHNAREPLIWGVGTNNVCFKDVMFDDSGVFGAESNAQIPAGNTIDNRLMCVRKIVAVYKKGI
ncbi:BppU family phage baseplate upper protein [Vagococcus salmoninarum]|uniref:BppU family phage baseplate upper protein n=1 Tax=Vagococcus salmoninarum TaxID=2739 RepID=UPI0028D07A55|nr:BppU family phage baseplate upper protein [Vagococcus salmoninarum]